MTATRIYTVTTRSIHDDGCEYRLVRAANVSQAIRHVSASLITARVASQDDLLGMRDVEVEQAGSHED